MLIREYVEAAEPTGIDGLHRMLALWMERHWDDNARVLRARLRGIQVAAGLLGAALTAWCVALTGR